MKNIKRFFAVLLIAVMSVSTVVFADENSDDTYIDYTKQVIETNFIGVTYDECEYYIENNVGMVKDAFQSYLPFTENNKLGAFVDFGEASVESDDAGNVTCSVIAVFENGQIKASVCYKIFNAQITPISISFVSADVDDKSLGEKMANAGLNTLIGMFTVVVVLFIILIIIYLFKFIPKIQEKLSNRNKSNAEIAVDNAISQIEENEELVDDLELVAVITAAIAAASGASSDGFVVRSIRKAKRNR